MSLSKKSRLAGLILMPAFALTAACSATAQMPPPAPANTAADPADYAQYLPDPESIKVILSQDIPWTGTEGRMQQYRIMGSTSEQGPYVLLLKWWPHQFSQPHMHENTRYISVLSGTWWNSSSTVYDESATYPVPAGSVVIQEGHQVHWDGAKDEPTVLMIAGMGPAQSIRVDEEGNPIPRD